MFIWFTVLNRHSLVSRFGHSIKLVSLVKLFPARWSFLINHRWKTKNMSFLIWWFFYIPLIKSMDIIFIYLCLLYVQRRLRLVLLGDDLSILVSVIHFLFVLNLMISIEVSWFSWHSKVLINLLIKSLFHLSSLTLIDYITFSLDSVYWSYIMNWLLYWLLTFKVW
jgi:hypothetical protein